VVRLKLLIVTFDPPQNIGGVEGRVRGYVTELTKSGHHVEVEAFAPEYLFSEEQFYGVPLHKCPSATTSVLPTLVYTAKLIRTKGLDRVFLLSGGITVFGVLLLLYCRLNGKRTAILLYGKDILTSRKGILGRSLLLLSQFIADRIVTNSRYTASLLPRFFSGKVGLLYPSVDSSLQPLQATSAAQNDGETILFVGRLVKRKGADDLIRAFVDLARDFPSSRLDIIGDGPERASLESLVASLGLKERVTFYGSLRGTALYQRYRRCAVVAMPSKTMPDDVEGFGTVFLEAGLAERASVGTYSGGIPEAIQEGVTGLLVREGDTEGLSMALRKLLADTNLRQTLGMNARARVLREFTWEVTADRLAKILA